MRQLNAALIGSTVGYFMIDNNDPQIFHLPAKKEAKFKKGIVALDQMKRRNR
jgi:hypothetical protein